MKNENAREENEERARSVFESFRQMVSYCEGLSCRHSYFTEYFDQTELPTCGKMCDHCVDKGKLQNRLQSFFSGVLGSKSVSSLQDCSSHDEYDIRYCDTKKSSTKKKTEYTTGFTSASALVEKQKKAWTIRAVSLTEDQIPGLTPEVRESNVTLLTENYTKNYDKAGDRSSELSLSPDNIRNVAVNAEFEIFTATKVKIVYGKQINKKLAEVKGDTLKGILNFDIKNWKPSKEKPPIVTKIQKSVEDGEALSTTPSALAVGSKRSIEMMSDSFRSEINADRKKSRSHSFEFKRNTSTAMRSNRGPPPVIEPPMRSHPPLFDELSITSLSINPKQSTSIVRVKSGKIVKPKLKSKVSDKGRQMTISDFFVKR